MIKPVDILLFLLILTPLVAAHEFGHFLVAKLFKMEVEEFAIGMGRPYFRMFRWKETDFNFRVWLLGGFVRVKGMMPEEDGSETKIPGGFYSKSPWSRIFMLLAGPIASVIAGWLCFVVFAASINYQMADTRSMLGEVSPGGPADRAGLKSGDLVTSIDGKPVATFVQLAENVRDNAGKELSISILRNGQPMTIKATPQASERPTEVITDNPDEQVPPRVQGQLKVRPATVAMAPMQAYLGFANTQFLDSFRAIGSMFRKPDTIRENVGGPIAIAEAVSQARSQGPQMVVLVAGLISISLGIMNLLPIPIFDGGQIMVAVIELFRRGRRLSYATQNRIAAIGATLIGLLIVFVFANDVRRMQNRPAPNQNPPTLQGTTPAK